MPTPPEDIRDAAQFICHRIHVGRHLWHSKRGTIEGTDYTHLMAAYLREEFANYREARTWLLDHGVIESDGLRYDGKATGYRLKGNPAIIRVQASETVSAKINARQRDNLRHYTKAQRHIARWLRRFDIDAEAANAFISTLKVRGVHSPLTDAQFQQLCLDSVRMINDGEWEHSVCHYGRFHSPFTRLLRELRQFVSYKGIGLVNVDIANSQPLMLGLLLLRDYPGIRENRVDSGSCDKFYRDKFDRDMVYRDKFYSDNKFCSDSLSGNSSCSFNTNKTTENPNATVATVDSPGYPHPPLPYLHDVKREPKTTISHSPDRTNDLSHPTENSDVETYLQLCEGGKLYEHLMELCGYTDRNLLKGDFFERVIFATGKRDYEMAKVFRRHFPSVWETIVKAKKDGYQRLPQKMQRAESRVMIDTVCFRLCEDYPDIPIITIHDSIMTIPEHVGTVKRLMQEGYAGVGLRPTIKVEAVNGEGSKENGPEAATAASGDRWGQDIRSEPGEVQMASGV
jgi:hypothetical protein